MSQSKRHSAVETATNTAVGFFGSYAITLACLHVPGTNLATQTLYATLGCTAWSLLRGYYLRRFFNHLHAKQTPPAPPEELLRQVPACHHLFVDGFGGMGDALACCKCGLSKYPEALPGGVLELAKRQGRVIELNHPEYNRYAELARVASRRH
jgi:hypothetical protein